MGEITMKNLVKKIGKGLVGLSLVFSMSSVAAIPALASSHSEAPLISMDRFADNTDIYAFRSAKPDVTGLSPFDRQLYSVARPFGRTAVLSF